MVSKLAYSFAKAYLFRSDDDDHYQDEYSESIDIRSWNRLQRGKRC